MADNPWRTQIEKFMPSDGSGWQGGVQADDPNNFANQGPGEWDNLQNWMGGDPNAPPARPPPPPPPGPKKGQQWDPFTCSVCDVPIDNMAMACNHFNGKPHRRKVEVQIMNKLEAKKCEVCGVSLTSLAQGFQHLNGYEHAWKLVASKAEPEEEFPEAPPVPAEVATQQNYGQNYGNSAQYKNNGAAWGPQYQGQGGWNNMWPNQYGQQAYYMQMQNQWMASQSQWTMTNQWNATACQAVAQGNAAGGNQNGSQYGNGVQYYNQAGQYDTQAVNQGNPAVEAAPVNEWTNQQNTQQIASAVASG